ncbi:hypothetical protein [Streptomyces sp. NK15101]|uniref:hypothetical protein n=1 Tax=Streptomyces sp. NK15101 TaxID=2873261 RepID=UPI001CEC80A4|nr:hypothetical protein [Streptomyces sp. NK15101]
MTNTAWRVALGVVASSAFFWAVAGAVDLGLERTRRGYALPDGGEWYTFALFAGFIVAYLGVASLTDTPAGRHAALVPAAGACFGAVSCLLIGQETRHWVGAAVMALIASALPLVVHLRNRARRARPAADAPA